jgi:hypothetical protein
MSNHRRRPLLKGHLASVLNIFTFTSAFIFITLIEKYGTLNSCDIKALTPKPYTYGVFSKMSSRTFFLLRKHEIASLILPEIYVQEL